MPKVSVNVCMGTTCFVMGGANLQELIEIIPRRYGDKVDIAGSACLGMCSIQSNYSKAPYVKINEDIIEEATVEKVIAAIEEKLGVEK